MSIIKMTNEEKVLVDAIISRGCVVEVVISPYDFMTHEEILMVEDFVATHSDKDSKTFINNIIRDNR